MSAYSEQLKRSRDQQAIEGMRTQASELASFAIIHQKSPTWFDALREAIVAECADMRRDVPDDAKYHGYVNEPRPRGFSVNSGKMPRTVLALDLDADKGRVTVCKREKRHIADESFPLECQPITITVGPDEELYFTFLGKAHMTPQSLATHIIAHVCQLPKPSELHVVS